jgi:hypothetical protein
MARHFAHKNRNLLSVLWIPADSESQITRAFESYAKQLYGNRGSYDEPTSLVRDKLGELYGAQWLVVYDGRDESSLRNHLHTLLDGITEGKLLVTPRNMHLAKEIANDHIFLVNRLDERGGEQLLLNYLSTSPRLKQAESSSQDTEDSNESDMRRRIVNELGGFPVPISAIGAFLRNSRNASTSCRDFLTWAQQDREMFLQRQSISTGYPSSVWKAFEFAFSGLLSSDEELNHVASLIFLVASCENGSNLAEYSDLYRQWLEFGHDQKPMPELSTGISRGLGFLRPGLLDDALYQLEGINMITAHWTQRGQGTFVPYIEMHSTIKKWVQHRNPGEVSGWTLSKLWLLGFGMYDQMIRGQMGLEATKFRSLSEGIKSELNCDNSFECENQALGVLLLFLVEAQSYLFKSIEHLPPAKSQFMKLGKIREDLEAEIPDAIAPNSIPLDGMAFSTSSSQISPTKLG